MNKIIDFQRLKIACILVFSVLINTIQAQDKPNIIFILADDLGYGDLSCYGAKDVKTPHIDEIAQSGIKFTRAYANSTVCSPSRAAILTGNYPDLVGVPGVIRDMPDNNWGNLKDDIETLPSALQKLNYKTALIGKWHLGYKSPDVPNERGFDFFKGFLGDMIDDYYTHRRAGVNWMQENNQKIDPKGHATDLFTDWSIDYLEAQKNQNQPFFLFLTYNAPHDPVQPPTEWLNKIKQREPKATLKRQSMIALTEHLDANVGRLLNYLKSSQLDKNTIIIFTSDNGGALQYAANNYPFSGGKGDMLEGGIRIPCVVKLPNSEEKIESDIPFLLMDFFPTLIKFAGGNTSKDLPSKPISALFNTAIDTAPRNMIWMRREGHKYGGKSYYAISDGTYKLLQNNPFTDYELFDLEADSLEAHPLEMPEISNSLKKILTKHIQNSGKIPWN
jgi:arylsulfatase A-like enzyme